MDLEIKDKVALIIGASKNIGKSIALKLAEECGFVCIVARDKKSLEQVVDEMPLDKNKKCFVVQDMQKENGPQRLIKKLEKKNIEPDIIIHNMGGSLGIVDPFCSRSELKQVWEYNLGISHEINIHFIPIMMKKSWGRCIHISTLAVKSNTGNLAYASSKHALEGYVKTFSKAVSKHDVIICAVAPGLVDLEGRYFNRLKKSNPQKLKKYFDEHLPIRRMLRPDEIGSLVTFLCSKKSSYMPGSIVEINGGGL